VEVVKVDCLITVRKTNSKETADSHFVEVDEQDSEEESLFQEVKFGELEEEKILGLAQKYEFLEGQDSLAAIVACLKAD